MKCKQEAQERTHPYLNAVFAAELFSKLPKDKQDIIIELLKDLLSNDDQTEQEATV